MRMSRFGQNPACGPPDGSARPGPARPILSPRRAAWGLGSSATQNPVKAVIVALAKRFAIGETVRKPSFVQHVPVSSAVSYPSDWPKRRTLCFA